MVSLLRGLANIGTHCLVTWWVLRDATDEARDTHTHPHACKAGSGAVEDYILGQIVGHGCAETQQQRRARASEREKDRYLVTLWVCADATAKAREEPRHFVREEQSEGRCLCAGARSASARSASTRAPVEWRQKAPPKRRKISCESNVTKEHVYDGEALFLRT